MLSNLTYVCTYLWISLNIAEDSETSIFRVSNQNEIELTMKLPPHFGKNVKQ